MKKCLTLFLVSLFFQGDAQDYSTVHPSPNIGWNLTDIQQQNQLHTGVTRLNIPIYNLTVGKIKVPIGISYLTKAIPVDQLPSWVGLGWNFAAGGQISRVVNGKPDEVRDTKKYTSILHDAGGGTHPTTYTVLSENDFGYISNNQYLNSTNWSTSDYLQNTLATLPYLESHTIENTFYYTYPPYQSQTIAYEVDYRYFRDFEPDEYQFTAGDLGGKFYLNHENKWICETNAGNFLIEPLLATEVTKGNRKIPRMFYGFVLIGPDGTKYIFGGNTSDYLKNVEFSRGPNQTATGGTINYNNFSVYASTYLPICPSAWYLTRIETPDNNYIDFNYKKGDFQVNYSDAPQGEGSTSSFTRKFPGSIHQSLVEPWYLTKIKGSNGIEIEIQSENSSQLSTNQQIDNLSAYSSFLPYTEIAASLTNANNNLQKVTKIIIRDRDQVKKQFQFEYFENTSERLKLKAFKQVSLIGSEGFKYSFEYNAGLLPNYGSGKVDHFGYYNEKKYFTDNVQTTFNVSRSVFESQYFDSREPDYNYAKRETLSKVFFPTGGYREYLYQPNEYSVKISQWPFNTSPLGANYTTGGIRIWKIVDYTKENKKASETEFIYKSDISGTLSSGVFSIPTPTYTKDDGNGGYYFATRSYIPFDRVISHITYSTVYEKYADGSYKKNIYWNYDDDGANDAAPIFESASHVYQDGQSFIRHHFKRGLLKSSVDYNSSGAPVKVYDYKYQHEYDSYTRFVRSARVTHLNSSNSGYKSAAYPIYYFPNVLRQDKVDLKSISQSIITQSDYTYDGHNNLVSVAASSSKGEYFYTTNKYPYNMVPANDPSGVYQEMINKNINSALIEKVVTKNTNVPINLTRTNFYQPHPGVFVPQSIQIQNLNKSIETMLLFNNYDNKGNLLEKQKTSDVKEAFFLGYNGKYVVAKLVGSDYNTAKNYISQSLLDNPPNDQALRDELKKLRDNLPNALITTYTYNPVVGMTSETDVNGRNTYYEYDVFGRLVLIRDQDKNILKKYCYNYSGQTEACDIFYNAEKTQSFTKNDCQSCATPSSIVYTVPANKYLATSLDEANAMAQVEIDQNGQIEANKGTCTPIIAAINSYNSTTYNVSVTFTNTSTYMYYDYTAPAGTNSQPPMIPCGTYNITMTVGVAGNYNYYINGYSQSTSETVTFYNVPIGGTISMSIGNNP